jgi:hypothetical protein
VASKVFKIIYDVELGKPNAFPQGRSLAIDNNDAEGRGKSKKRMSICNELNRGSKFALIRKDADLLYGVLLYERRYDL